VRQNKLSFPILSDAKGKVGAAVRPPLRAARLSDRALQEPQERSLPTFNDDPSWTLPMPARYVIGQDGTILYSEVNPDYTHPGPEPEDMIAGAAAGRRRKGLIAAKKTTSAIASRFPGGG